MRLPRLLLLLAAACAALAAAPAAAQQTRCALRENRMTNVQPAGEFRVGYISGPLLVTCDAGEQLRADSAEIYEQLNEVRLYGRVDYQDPTRALTADQATYNSQTGRLFATGNVVFTDRNRGSTLRGPQLEYFRAMPGRPESQTLATGRPHMTVVPRAEPGRPAREPMEVDSDQLSTVGDRFVTATGTVLIRSRDVVSRAQEAFYDATTERLELRRDASVDGASYDLFGGFIETDLEGGRVDRVLARTNARLVSEKLTVTAPQIRMSFAGDLLQRLVAGREVGAVNQARSIATASGFRMEADSLEAELPAQKLRLVKAIGRARGEAWDTAQAAPVRPAPAAGDSARPAAARADTIRVMGIVLGERDLILADTILGFFVQVDGAGRPLARADTASARADTTAVDAAPTVGAAGPPTTPAPAAADTAGEKTELERMLALGSARSVYRMRDRDKPDQPPGINYLTGDTIDLSFRNGEIDVALVRGLQRGVYLDPTPRAAGDTARTPTPAVPGRPGGRTAPVPAGNRPAAPPPTAPGTTPPAKTPLAAPRAGEDRP